MGTSVVSPPIVASSGCARFQSIRFSSSLSAAESRPGRKGDPARCASSPHKNQVVEFGLEIRSRDSRSVSRSLSRSKTGRCRLTAAVSEFPEDASYEPCSNDGHEQTLSVSGDASSDGRYNQDDVIVHRSTISSQKLKTLEDLETELDATDSVQLVDEYRLSPDGDLSEVEVSVGGSNRMLSIVHNLFSQLKPCSQLLLQAVQKFSITEYISNIRHKKPGKQAGLNSSTYYSKEGVATIARWTSTELTLQHEQIQRIAVDTFYLVCAFSLFGIVRILEAVAAAFATNPPDLKRLLEVSNALDPITVAFLANGLRKPIVALLHVDPTNLDEVSQLKSQFLTELHAFYERQWKVMATLGIARLLNLIATNVPATEFVTSKLKLVWNMLMALPIF